MTTSNYSPLTRTTTGRAGDNQHHQPIDAHYYNVTDDEAWPIAGLLVLLDGQGMPVRAELHVDESVEDDVVVLALRRARLVLQDQYIGGNPVELRMLENFQMRTPIEVQLPPRGVRPEPRRVVRSRQNYLVGAGILLVTVLLLWLVSTMFRPADSPDLGSETPIASVDGVATGANGDSEVDQQNDVDSNETAVAEGADVAAEATDTQNGASDQVFPPSRNARPDLQIGMQVRIVPGLQLALRSEPGADAGVVIGAMADGTVATIIGGPRYTRGTDDTIVWWLVQLDNGNVEAWAAANTSRQTLLIPVE